MITNKVLAELTPLTLTLKTTELPDQSPPGKNNNSKQTLNRNDAIKPASERNNGDGKVVGFGVGDSDGELSQCQKNN